MSSNIIKLPVNLSDIWQKTILTDVLADTIDKGKCMMTCERQSVHFYNASVNDTAMNHKTCGIVVNFTSKNSIVDTVTINCVDTVQGDMLKNIVNRDNLEVRPIFKQVYDNERQETSTRFVKFVIVDKWE